MQTKIWGCSSSGFLKRKIWMLVTVVSMLLSSCKKEINVNLNEGETTESFFKSVYVPQEAEPVIGALKKQLAEKGFLNEFITSNGFPQWEVSLMLKGKGDTLYTLLVPTKKENQIDAFFAATVNRNGQVLFEMHRREVIAVPEYSYVGITREKALFFLDKFDRKDHKLQRGGDTATSNYVVEICWYQWENTCIATEANIVTTNCWKLRLHCEDFEGNDIPGGGETGGGTCPTCPPPPPPCFQGYWYSNVIPEEGPCSGGGWNGENSPGDKLCSGSFNLRSGNDNAFWETHMTNLRFEDGAGNMNTFNAYYDLHNSISDVAMNMDIYPSPYGPGVPSKSALDYLHDFFPELFTSGDITNVMEYGISVWRFSKHAAQKIATKCSNQSATIVGIEYYGVCAQPGFIPAQTAFRTRTQAYLRCFMPTSNCISSPSASTNISYASYSPLCN